VGVSGGAEQVRVFRQDDRDFQPGELLRPWGDHFATLADENRGAEDALRTYEASSSEVRSNSIYTWRDRAFAERTWPISGKTYLYELEVEECRVRHVGDVNCFTAIKAAIAAGEPFEDHVACYWSGGAQPGEDWTEPRIEVLVCEAKVIARFEL